MRYFAQGLLSAAIIHKIVQAACKDIEQASEGLMVNGLDEIATLTHGKNLHRSMMAKLGRMPLSQNLSRLTFLCNQCQLGRHHPKSFFHMNNLFTCATPKKDGMLLFYQILQGYPAFGNIFPNIPA